MKQAVEQMLDGDLFMILVLCLSDCPDKGFFQCFAEHSVVRLLFICGVGTSGLFHGAT